MKKASERFKAALIMLASAFCASTGQIFWKKSSYILKVISLNNLIRLATNFYFILGVLLYGLGFILMVIALRRGELSRLHALYGFGFIWGLFLAHIIFHESISLMNILGVELIIIGGYFITKK